MDVWESGEERLRIRCGGYCLGVVGRARRVSPIDDVDHCITVLNALTDGEIRSMGEHARELVTSRLTVREMAGRAMEVIGRVTG